MSSYFKKTEADIDDKTLDTLRKINSEGFDGGCQFASIEAAKVILKKDYQPATINEDSDFEKLKDPLEEYLEDAHVAHITNPRDLLSELEDLENGELVIVNGGHEAIDHAFIIYKGKQSLWLIDADRNIYQPIKDFNDFIQPVSGWEKDRKKEHTHLNYLKLKLIAPPKISLEEKDFTGRNCIFDLYKISKNNVSILDTIPIPSKKRLK